MPLSVGLPRFLQLPFSGHIRLDDINDVPRSVLLHAVEGPFTWLLWSYMAAEQSTGHNCVTCGIEHAGA